MGGGLPTRVSRRTASSYFGSSVAFAGPRAWNSPSWPMQAIPQPSGWPDLGFGWGHPKSRKFLPVSARARNAMSVSTGAGFWLRIASIRHMSAQLVPNLPEERDPLRPVFRGLEAFGPLPVDDPEDAPAPPRGRDDDVDGIRGRGVDGHDFGHVAQRPQDVDWVSVFHEDDEEVARPDRERVFRGERLQAFIVPLDADETRPGRLAERHAELDPGYGPDERFVDVLRRLDEVRLAEDHVQPARVLDRDEFRLDRHRQCIGPRELSLLLAEVEVRYLHAEGTGIGIASESHGGNQRVVDDPRQRRGPGGARGPHARGDGDSSALREPRRSGTVRRGIHGDPVPVAGLAHASTAWSARGARSASRVPGPRRQLDQGLRGRRPAARARGHRPRARRVI